MRVYLKEECGGWDGGKGFSPGTLQREQDGIARTLPGR